MLRSVEIIVSVSWCNCKLYINDNDDDQHADDIYQHVYSTQKKRKRNIYCVVFVARQLLISTE